MLLDFEGCQIELEVTGEHHDDIQIDYAYNIDEERDLTDSEIDRLQYNHADELYDEWINNKVCIADYLFDD